MATPIENNTEGLEEILRAVNDLPNAEGGGVLCVTADFSTMTASHSPAEILEAVNSGKGVNLCVYDTAALIVLPLVGCDASLQQATFCNTVSAVGEFGTQFGIIHAIVHADKSVTFDNDGSVLSMCVPVAENTDVGKVLSVSANGLAWVKPSEGGGSGGGSCIPVIDLRELGFPDVTGPGYGENVMFDQTTYNTLKAKIEYGVVMIKMYASFGAFTLTCHSEIYENHTVTEHYAVCISSDGYKYSFMLGYGDGLYGASFYLYDK